MAKKKKSHHRRRRVSGISKSDPIMVLAGAGIGYAVGNMISTKVTTLDPKILAAIQIAIPVIFAKKLKPGLMQGVGIGMGVSGIKEAGKAFNIAILSGMPVVNGMAVVNGPRRRMGNYVGGSADQPYLRTGAAGNNVLSGVPKKTLTAEEIYAGTMMPDYRDQ